MAARRGDAIVALVAICAALATLPDARVHGFKANDFKKCEDVLVLPAPARSTGWRHARDLLDRGAVGADRRPAAGDGARSSPKSASRARFGSSSRPTATRAS